MIRWSRTRRTLAPIATAVLVLLVAVATDAIDVPMPATVTVVKPGTLAKLVSKSPAPLSLPAPGSAEDPTISGARLTVFDTAFLGAGRATFTLGAAGWTGLGKPPGSRGYRYKGKKDGAGAPCKSVLLEANRISAVCKGAAVTLTPPFSAAAGVLLGLPAGTAATRYCAEVGGSEKKNDAKVLERVDAPAPLVCPELPSAFDPNDVIALADDALQGRNNNTPGSFAAQQLLLAALKPIATGLDGTQSGDAAYEQPFVQSGQIGTNILALIPGGALANEYVVVGAHYDHLGSNCRSVKPADTVCNGATDNAAGVAAVLAVGRSIVAQASPPQRSVVLALWDAEEDGLLGSFYYVNHPLVPLASTVAYVNFDIQGANLLPSLRHYTFAVGSETGAGLGTLVDQATAGIALDYRRLSYIFGQGRSDYVNFVSHQVPTVFFSDSTGPCYHTNGDEVSVVDFAKLELQSQAAAALTLSLANAATPPTFVAPSPALAAFTDAEIVSGVLTDGLADLSLFSPADQSQLLQSQSDLAGIVAGGAANFDSNDITTLLLDTLNLVNLLTDTPCDGFL